MGWSTRAGGSVEFTGIDEVINLKSENGDSITLYAIWEIKTCKVTFMVDGEVFAEVTVDYGTSSADVIGQAVNTVLYEPVEGQELPN